jgi:hypothetical protein
MIRDRAEAYLSGRMEGSTMVNGLMENSMEREHSSRWMERGRLVFGRMDATSNGTIMLTIKRVLRLEIRCLLCMMIEPIWWARILMSDLRNLQFFIKSA